MRSRPGMAPYSVHVSTRIESLGSRRVVFCVKLTVLYHLPA